MTASDSLPYAEQLSILRDVARAALDHYDLPPDCTVSLVNLSENATYKVEAPDGRRWALRVHRDGYHSRAAIASELAWRVALRNSSVVATPIPVAGRDGDTIQNVTHPRLLSPRHIVLSRWETGAEPGIGEDLSGPFETLGEVTARMHIHALKWQRPPWFTRLIWDFKSALGSMPHWGRWRDGVGLDAAMEKIFARTVTVIGCRLNAYGKAPERFGLIHCDLRLANLLTEGHEVKVIDFDDCGFSWYMYDAATPVSFYEHEPQVPALLDAWKAGYRKVLPILKDDEAEIPTFIMLRRILLVAWVASHIEAEFPRQLGAGFTAGTIPLCEDYLSRFG
ncbi:phosphotransferase enzyme family protein [Aestuariivirga sp.]|uniref:phosphotransferase enzyme family protein n=1 Tax=Aestuariivirga sp. TaxID=2650926 RepID=UPI0039E67C70